ncbi:MAG: nascent polypeptide-associated complex protein [Candidatus Thermoplasmatota archaeon]|nr:nascent polypeptide-associated complex protein [Candidatus Thermoplasmatota archaeon]
MMAQMGIKATDLTDVKRVVMEGTDRDYVIDAPQVTRIEAQGEVTFQIVGKSREVKKNSAQPSAEAAFSEDDIHLVMDQAHVSREKAVEALSRAGGEPAKAIVDLLS